MVLWVSREPQWPQLFSPWLSINSKSHFDAKKLKNKNLNISFVFSRIFLCKFETRFRWGKNCFFILIFFSSSLKYPSQNTRECAQIKTKNMDFQCTLMYSWLGGKKQNFYQMFQFIPNQEKTKCCTFIFYIIYIISVFPKDWHILTITWASLTIIQK